MKLRLAAALMLLHCAPALALDDASIPTKFPIPWGNSAGGGFIRPIPVASQISIQAGAASLTDGFPPITFTPVGAGGIPPFGQDFNGIFNQITAWSRWYNAGAPVGWDSGFSSSIGGYPKGSVVAASTFGNYWLNTVDNNATNPDSGGANWTYYSPLPAYVADTGTTNAIAAVFSPAVPSMAQIVGKPLRVKIANTNTSSTVTLQVNGLTAATVANGSLAPCVGQLQAGSIVTFVWDGANAQIAAGASRCAATFTALTSGSGTFNTPAGATLLKIRLAGGGGGGAGSGSGTSGGNGGNGGATTFGSVTAAGGNAGQANNAAASGPGGAVSSTGAGTAFYRVKGAAGGQGARAPTANFPFAATGNGGVTPLGGAGVSGAPAPGGTAGGAAQANTGSGGGGACDVVDFGCGGGGGAGEYAEFNIAAPASSYSWSVGAAGSAGAAGTSGDVGGAGGSGAILIEVDY